MSGIYEIVHAASGKRYIGSTVNIEKRWKQHRRSLARGDHHSVTLQRAWDKHGSREFEWRVLLICAPAQLIFFEQMCLDGMQADYNTFKVAGSPLGTKHPLGANTGKTPKTREWRAKLSEALRGIKHTPKRRQAQAAAQKGIKHKPRSPEALVRIGIAARRRSASMWYRAKLSEGQKRRAPFPPDHCAKLAAAANRRWDRVRGTRTI